jgi:hypothetical protein
VAEMTKRGDLRSLPGLLASSKRGGVLSASPKEDVVLSGEAFAAALRVWGAAIMEALVLSTFVFGVRKHCYHEYMLRGLLYELHDYNNRCVCVCVLCVYGCVSARVFVWHR